MAGMIDPSQILEELQSMYDPSYQKQLFVVDRALEQSKGLPKATAVSNPENELDAKLLELIDSVAME